MSTDDFIGIVYKIRQISADSSWSQLQSVLDSIGPDASISDILSASPFSTNGDLYYLLKSSLEIGKKKLGWKEISLCFKVVDRLFENEKSKGSVDLLWTGPSDSSRLIRRTDQVLYDLVAQAQNEILLVTFAAYKIQLLEKGLREASSRGVRIRMILEFSEPSQDQLSVDALKAFGEVIPTVAQIYYWPSEIRECNQHGHPGKLHAKCAVIDDKAIISSANLTDAAFNLNMELGVLFNGGTVPIQIKEHFEDLISKEILVQVR